jgi:hypothetical protein
LEARRNLSTGIFPSANRQRNDPSVVRYRRRRHREAVTGGPAMNWYWLTDFLWPEYCACGEQMIGGVCPLDVELGDR